MASQGVIEAVAELGSQCYRERQELRSALVYVAQHLSSDWPERCQSNVRTARAALLRLENHEPPNV